MIYYERSSSWIFIFLVETAEYAWGGVEFVHMNETKWNFQAFYLISDIGLIKYKWILK